jgi:two-component system, NarL family, nitrate/nitrite response regulator NarL
MRVIIIDDHPLVRRGLIDVLSIEEQFTFSGEAMNVDESLKLIQKVNPELALVDLRLGNEWGLDVVEKAKSNGSKCKFVLLTSSATKEDFLKAKEAHIDGFINKSALPEELLYAIKLVGQGRKYYDPTILDLMMETSNEAINNDRFVEQLTPKEVEVLKLLGMGLTNRQIAHELFVTEYTVKKHVSQVLAKLELTDRTQAALYANTMGIAKFVVN